MCCVNRRHGRQLVVARQNDDGETYSVVVLVIVANHHEAEAAGIAPHYPHDV